MTQDPIRRRRLVLTTESARHPFRASLPPHIFALAGRVRSPLDRSDWRRFLTSYASCFAAVSAFIA
jgi:hypothetical protein